MPEVYLQVEIQQRRGDLSLQVSCALSATATVLFGPSGAGKTSLLRVLAGLTRPDLGRVIFQGKTLVDTAGGAFVPPAERSIGFVTQSPALFPHMTVSANVAFGLADLGRREQQERVGRMLELFQAGHLAERSPGHLSGGEKQRVALARALAPQPRLLLLDEPFTGMDAALKISILEPLKAWLAERNTPALYVSHDVADAFLTGAEVLVIDDGRIKAQGSPAVVLSRQRELLLRQLGC